LKIKFRLDVPIDSDYNYIMEIKEIEGWVDEEMSELYWKFRNDVDDEGGERIKEELEFTSKLIVKIINKHKTVE
tara:strand:+ start:584 stop:805 length:222 start_codon:yes stop_codon:yes gene_type:complete